VNLKNQFGTLNIPTARPTLDARSATIIHALFTFAAFCNDQRLIAIVTSLTFLTDGLLRIGREPLEKLAQIDPDIAGPEALPKKVDANVLIYERIREEVRGGRTLLSSLDAGFKRAFGTILDSHVTTLVAGFLMFWLGSGPVKGFAVTLSIGVLTSLFSAILVTRLLIVTWLRQWKPKAIPI